MNILKIMTDFLKQVSKDDTARVLFGIDEEFTYLSPDGYRCFVIPNDKFLIDLSKAVPYKLPIENIKEKFFNDQNSREAVKTIKLTRVGNSNVIAIANDEVTTWVREDYLKEFAKDCTFKISSPKSPVFVYEKNILVGMILPVAGIKGV